ncbi:MAG: lipopolysaccharide assembly protein LapA domain-containing protein [Pseudomonadota bacterium]
MLKLVSQALWLAALVLIVAFFTANRQVVVLSFDPFSAESPSFTAPPLQLWMVILLSMFAGFFFGAAGMWATGRGVRTRSRQRKRAVKDLQKEVRQATQAAAAVGRETLPAVR